MPRITLPDVEFEVFCTCGSGLWRSTSVDEYRNGKISLKIDPCENCLENAKQDGYNEGHDQGYDDAEAERREGYMTTEEDTLNIIINRKDIEGLDNLRDIFAAILEGGVGVTVEYYLDLQEEEG